MRGEPNRHETMLSLWTPEQRALTDHPLRKVKALRVLKALLLMALYSARSERQLCEQLDYNLLFRWFLDMNPIEDSFDATVFSDRTVAGH
ncbi:MAG: transposase, partial [Candidatus Zixiibacteriota bacterium]